jgi:hypothetical protein
VVRRRTSAGTSIGWIAKRPAQVLAHRAQAPLVPVPHRADRKAIHVLQAREMQG